jgi:predicted exporter
MSRRAAVAVITLWLLSLALALMTIIQAPPLQSDLTQFLPVGNTSQQRLLLEEISGGGSSRLLIAAIAGGSASQRAAASRALASALRTGDLFEQVLNGQQQVSAEERDLLFAYRYLLSRPGDYSVAGLQAALSARLAELASPLSLIDKSALPADPTAVVRALLQRWQPVSAPSRSAGVWVNKEGSLSLLLLQTRAQAFELDRQQQTIEATQQTFSRLPEAANLTLLLSGGPLFGVESRRTISGETRNLTLLASLGVVLLLWWRFRSLPVLLVAVLPLASGVVIGTAAVMWLFGAMHGITLAFGITLIGIAVDYPIHFFSHLQQTVHRPASLRHLWSTLLLGVLTTMLGFSSLIFSGFTGLSQLGLFSVAGLAASALVTRFLLPLLVVEIGVPLRPVLTMPLFLSRRLPVAAMRLLPLLTLLLSGGYLLVVQGQIWETELSKLSPVAESAKRQYETLRSQLGVEDFGRMLLIRGDSEQHVLQRSEQLERLLHPAVADGLLHHVELPTHYLPSEHEQRYRQSLLPDSETLRANLQQALTTLPFKPGLFAPFLAQVEESRQLPPLNRARLADTAIGTRLGSLLMQRDATWFGIARLTGVTDEDALRGLAASNAQWLSYLNVHQESSQLVVDYLHEALYYFAIAVVVIVLLLLAVMRSLLLVWRVFMPVAAAVALAAALQVLLGERLSLFHVAALLLVLGIGLDYALFVVRTPRRSADFTTTMHSLLICNGSTLLVFGLLAQSEVPVLHAIGLTVTLGAFAVLLFSFMMVHDDPLPRTGA